MNMSTQWAAILLIAISGPATAAVDSGVRDRLSALSVPFVANSGQWDSRAAFAAPIFAGTVFVTREGKLVYRLAPGSSPSRPSKTSAWVLTESLIDAHGATIRAKPIGSHRQPGSVSYAIGNDETKHADALASYERVDLGEVYPGIGMHVRATGVNVEKIFVVAPGADPSSIRLRIDGAHGIRVGPRGDLVVRTGNGDISYTAPIAWQEFDGARNVVGVGYVLDNDAFGYGFALAAYDASRPLIIDPLLQSTYLGGNGFDVAAGIAIHPATGDVYVVGTTLSSDFPSVVGAEQPGNAALYDVFVTRLNAALTTRLQSTYIGGSSDDFGNAIAIHPVSGEIYVTGQTTSADFPKIVGSEQPVKAPGSDGFVTRLNAALTARLQSTYLGGNDNDIPTSIAIHPVSGEVYVTGQTASSDFPKVAGSEQPVKGGAGTTDAFVTRLNAALTQRLQSTYVGGSGNDGASAIAIHPVTGEVYIGGVTTSADLPKVTGSEQPVKGVNFDGFVTRLNAALTLRLQSTYLGGNAGDQVNGLAIHPMTGEIYAAGYTTSTDFPKLAGSEQTVKNALADGYVTRFNPSLTNILQSTLIGGNGDDFLQSVAIHPLTGEVYVAGYVLGTTDFPKTAGAEQPAKAAGMDSVIVRLNAGLTTRLQATYLGASGDDYLAAGMTIHPVTGEIYLAGRTSSTDFPKVSGSEQPTKSTIEDAFVARYSADLTLNDNVPDTFGNFAAQSGVPVQSVRTSNPLRVTGIFGSANLYIDGQPGSSYCISSANNCSCDVSGGFLTAPTTVGNNAYVCVRHTASAALNQLSRTDLHVGGGRASFIATTGALIGGSCTLDVDGDGGIDALSDGLIMLRAMFGLTGTSVTANAVRPGATRTIWAQIQPYLNGNCGTSFAP